MSTLQAAVKQSVSQKVANELTYKIMSIVRRKAEAGDKSAQATIADAMESLRGMGN